MGKINQNPVGGLIRKAQDQLEKRAGSINNNESVLQQDRFWLKATTWALIGTTVFGIGWLAIAKTEEIVVAPGKREPIGAVKEVKVPIGGVVDQILVKEGERVKQGQILLRLDTEASSASIKVRPVA